MLPKLDTSALKRVNLKSDTRFAIRRTIRKLNSSTDRLLLSVAALGIFIWWAIDQGASGVRGRSPGSALGNEILQKLKQFADNCLQVLTAETVKII